MGAVYCVPFCIDNLHPSAVVDKQKATSFFLVYFVNFVLNIPERFSDADSLLINEISDIFILEVKDGFDFRLDHVEVRLHVSNVLASKLCVL